MKRDYIASIILLLAGISLFGCAPVIRNDLMETGMRNVPLLEVRQNPDLYKGKLFILGGIIAGTTVTPEGSLIDALYVFVDPQGYLTGNEGGRYLAIFPKENGVLDPMIYHKGRRITIAAEFVRMHRGKSDEEFAYPLFEIKQIHLWEEGVNYYPQGPYWRYNPHWWN
jgi:outer membrane lipoprotein